MPEELNAKELRERMQQLLDQNKALADVLAGLGASPEATQVKSALSAQTSVLEATLAELSPVSIPPGQFEEEEEKEGDDEEEQKKDAPQPEPKQA